MSEDDVNEVTTEPGQSADPAGTQPAEAAETVTVVEVSNLDEIYSYQQLHAGLLSVMIGVMLALIIAIAWRSMHE